MYKKIIIVLIAILLASMFIGSVMIHGWHVETFTGEHTGYITAVERGGIFFKNNTVYLKTDPQSSQEDAYCVVDESLIPILKELSVSRERVTVSFNDYLIRGLDTCTTMMVLDESSNGVVGIITGIKSDEHK
jgi:hypothetical protein